MKPAARRYQGKAEILSAVKCRWPASIRMGAAEQGWYREPSLVPSGGTGFFISPDGHEEGELNHESR